MTVVVDGLITNYEKSGSGPTVLLLHGWGDTLHTFDALVQSLESDYTVIRLDLPGFGKTDNPKETFTLQRYAEFVNHFIQKIDVKGLDVIVGHSNGGAIAIKAVSMNVLKPKKLVLLASSGIRSTYKGRKKALRLAAKTAKLPTKLMPKHLQAKLKRRAYATIGSDLFVAEHLQKTFKEVVGEDLLTSSANITTDTLLLYGTEDTATLPAYGSMFAKKIRNSQLHVIEGAGHYLHQSHASQVESYLKEFIS